MQDSSTKKNKLKTIASMWNNDFEFAGVFY